MSSTSQDIREKLGGVQRTAFWDSQGAMLIVFDAVTKESHRYSSMLTNHPIEDGSNISDHKVFNPIELTLNIVQSGNPINILTLATAAAAVGGLVGGLIQTTARDGSLVSAFGESTATGRAIGSFVGKKGYDYATASRDGDSERIDRPDRKALDQLTELWKNSTMVTVRTPMIEYRNMQIKNIQFDKDSSSATSLIAQVNLQQIVQAKSSTVRVDSAKTKEIGDRKNIKQSAGFLPSIDPSKRGIREYGGLHPYNDPVLQQIAVEEQFYPDSEFYNSFSSSVVNKVQSKTLLNTVLGG